MECLKTIRTQGDTNKYIKGVRSITSVFKGPDTIEIQITNRCNLSCVGCKYNGRNGKKRVSNKKYYDMPLEIFRDIVRQAKKIDVRTVVVTGQGEPFMHPHIVEIIECVKKCGLRCLILTNGLLINEKVLLHLNKLKVDRISLSLWCENQKDYAFLHNTSEKKFYLIEEWFKRRNESRYKFPIIKAIFVICKRNYRNIPDMLTFCEKFNIEDVKFKLWRLDYDEPAYKEILFQDNKDLQELICIVEQEHLKCLNKKYKERLWQFLQLLCFVKVQKGEYYSPTIPCYIGWLSIRINLNGNISPCTRANDYIAGNIGTHSLSEIFLGEKFSRFREKITEQRMYKDNHIVCKAVCPDFHINLAFDKLMKSISGEKSVKNDK